eukprot:668460-Pleurochrysis_carterae.AAC.1
MTARTVGVSNSEPFAFQSAAMQGYRRSRENLQKQYKNERKCKTAKQEWHAKPNERFRNNNVVNREDTSTQR